MGDLDVVAELAAVCGLLDRLVAEPATELVEESLRWAAQAEELLRTFVIDRLRHLPADPSEPALSPADWLARETPISGARAVATAALGDRLGTDLTATDAALHAGTITTEQAAVIAGATRGLTGDDHDLVERLLLERCSHLDVTPLREAGKQLRVLVSNRATSQQRWDDARAARCAELTQVGVEGLARLDGLLDPECAGMLRAVLDSLGQPGPDDQRTPGQRRHDALAEALRGRLATGDLPAVNGSRPQLQVVITPATAGGWITGEGPVPASVADRLACEAETSVTLVREAREAGEAREAVPEGLALSDALAPADDLALTDDLVAAMWAQLPVALGGMAREVLTQGRSDRLATAAQRRALGVRDRGCIGCGRAARQCIAHHVVPWSEGGGTDLDNLVLLCRRCHHLVHDAGWLVHREQLRYVLEPPGRRRRRQAA